MNRLFRWRVPRRIVSIGAILCFLALFVAGAPLLVPAALIADAAGEWRRHRWLRLYAIIVFYLANELAGLFLMLVAWLFTGFGWKTRSSASERFLGKVLGWWTHNLYWGISHLVGAKFEVHNREAVDPAPVAVFSRHISYLDAIIPAVLLTKDRTNMPRHVLMKELLWEPCIDVVGHRTPNHFLDRSAGGDKELEAIRAIGRTAGPTASPVIFPEGGFRTQARFERSIERLGTSAPQLVDRAAALRHVSPPRPNGSRALLQGAAGVDVVIVAHCGFEGLNSFKGIIDNVPLNRPVVVELKRIPRAEIPMEEHAFHSWLLEQYEWIDDFAERHISTTLDLTDNADVEPQLQS